MNTKRGRAGEFANCFGMLCRAAGARVRWVWNSEDSVWIEVYSHHRRRWVHVDPCEELWNMPRVYTEGKSPAPSAVSLLTSLPGWNRQFAYCIAFSSEGATDVTRRYVRSPVIHGKPRTKCPEEVLLWIMYEIRKLRRDGMNKPEQQNLRWDDEREEKELQSFVATSVTQEMLKSMPGSQPSAARSGEQKAISQSQQAQYDSTLYVPHQQPPR